MGGGGGKEWVDEIFLIVCIGVSLDVVPKKALDVEVSSLQPLLVGKKTKTLFLERCKNTIQNDI
jgi:hypothetical protein